MTNLKLLLKEAVSRYREKTAIVSGEHRLSYSALDIASNRVANTLIEIGVNKGDRVALLLSNSLEYAIIFLGIVKAGAVAVPLDIKYKINELGMIYGENAIETLDEEIQEIYFPVTEFPTKIISHNFDKEPVVRGVLLGIKGQYLIFDTGVINLRKFTSYEISVS